MPFPWKILPQTREAVIERESAKLAAILDRGAEDARNADPVVREFVRMSAEARRDGCDLDPASGMQLAREAVADRTNGMTEAKRAAAFDDANRRMTWTERMKSA